MTVISNRDGHRPRGVRAARALAAVLGIVGLLLVSGCGKGAQTLRPYTPAEGVNFDVGTDADAAVVHVRNLLIISREEGSGILSASIVTTTTDSLTAISGRAIKSDGSPGAPFTATLPTPIALNPNAQVVLTARTPLLTVTSADLAPGLTADVTMEFAKAGSQTVQVTVVDGNVPPYESISPSASGSATPEATASPTP